MMSAPSSPTDQSAALRLRRKSSSSKMVLKEKIVQIYEAFFRGEDPSTGNANFWDELFLLKVNFTFLESELDRLTGEQLVALKDTMNELFCKCVEALRQDHPVRVGNALQTLCALIRGVFSKCSAGLNAGFDVIDVLVGFSQAEATMHNLVEQLNGFIHGEYPSSLKTLALQVFLVLVTATDNISRNTMLEYIMINSVFESIIEILGTPAARVTLGHDAILLLTLLVQYRKYESANPYVVKLSILDDELALNGYAHIISTILSDFNRQYQVRNADPEGGFFASLSSMVGSMFVSDDKKPEVNVQELFLRMPFYLTIENDRGNDAILLTLYEAIHLNRNFNSTLTNSHTTCSPQKLISTSSTPTTTPTVTPSTTPTGEGPSLSSAVDTAPEPTNLLVTFLEYSSIIMQDIRDKSRYNNAKLCFVILTCVAEDQYANSLMHDVNMNFRVPLHKTPMRHRKAAAVDKQPVSRPLAAALIDLMVEFIQSHLMKNFPMDLYMRCIGVLHRMLCYQKKCRVRLLYPWKDLWTGLINVLKFLTTHESHLVAKHDIFQLAIQVSNVFNVFITYGDMFLPNPGSYDELYYEVIRTHQIFDNLFSMALRYTTTDGQWKDSAIRLTSTLANIRTIINHFTPKVDKWAATQMLASLTEEQVLDVVRGNYDSLTLKIQDSLDQYERYAEKPGESVFFTTLVVQIIREVRQTLASSHVTQKSLLQNFSTIT